MPTDFASWPKPRFKSSLLLASRCLPKNCKSLRMKLSRDNRDRSVEKKLASVNPNTEVGKVAVSALETVLKGLESKLTAEIRRLGGGVFYAAVQRDRLRSEARRLRNLAFEESRRLENLGKSTLAREIRVLEEEIVAIEKKIELADPATEAGRLSIASLEVILKDLEARLERDLHRINGSVFYAGVQRDQIRSEAERLRNLAREEIRRQESLGKATLAREVRVLEEEIISLEKKIQLADPATEAGRLSIASLETVLRGVEARLEAELKRLRA